MFTFHIYLGDTCIGTVEANSPDNALTIYALRTSSTVDGLTAVYVPETKDTPIPEGWASI